MPGWFISALVACWLLERLMLRLASLGARRPLLTALVLFPLYVLLCPWASLYPVWANYRVFPWLSTWSPLQHGYVVWATVHLHHYYAGALLAYVLHRRAADGRTAVPWLGTVSMLAMAAVFASRPQYNTVIHQLGKEVRRGGARARASRCACVRAGARA
eukprot:713564-Prymnesium_polylepis.1